MKSTQSEDCEPSAAHQKWLGTARNGIAKRHKWHAGRAGCHAAAVTLLAKTLAARGLLRHQPPQPSAPGWPSKSRAGRSPPSKWLAFRPVLIFVQLLPQSADFMTPVP